MNEEINHCIQLYREGRFLVNSERNMEIDSHSVQEQVKKGRTLLLCSCQNHTKFCNEGAMCRHKLFFILYPLLKKLNKKVEDMEIFYRGAIELDKQVRPEYVLDDLKELKRLK